MIDFLSYVVGGLAIGLLLYEFAFRKGELFGQPTDCSEEDVPIIEVEIKQ